MSKPIEQQIRSLRSVPRGNLEDEAEAIKSQIDQLLKTGGVSEAVAAQLAADVNNERARILMGGKSDHVMSHVCDEAGRVISSRIEYTNGRIQTRERDAAGNLTDWAEITPPDSLPSPLYFKDV